MEHRGVAPFEHVCGESDFHRAPAARIGDEAPNRRRTGSERSEIPQVQRRDKTVRVDPNPRPLGKDVAIHRHARMQIGGEQAIVFRFDRAEINTNAGHAPDAIGEQDERLFKRRGRSFFTPGFDRAGFAQHGQLES